MEIEELKVSCVHLMKQNHNGDYLTIRHGKRTVSMLLRGVFDQNMAFLDFLKFFAKFID